MLLILGYVVIPALAVIASLALTSDAASPMGDGMILGCLLLAFPIWPLTMSLWLLYVLKRHAEAIANAPRPAKIRAPSRHAEVGTVQGSATICACPGPRTMSQTPRADGRTVCGRCGGLFF